VPWLVAVLLLRYSTSYRHQYIEIMKSDSASILQTLIIEKSINGLSPKDQLLLDELIASGRDDHEMPNALRQAIIADGMAYVDKTYGSGNRNVIEKCITMAVDSGSKMESESSLGELPKFADESFGEFRPRGVYVGGRSPSGARSRMRPPV